MGLGNIIYNQYVKPNMSDYMGFVFEKMCKDYLYQEHIFTTLPFIPDKIGKWWGNDMYNSRVVNLLNERKRIFKYAHVYLMAFSKSEFTKDVIKYANENCIQLINFNDM